jgi:phosphoglycolate phosphatase
VIQAILFDLDGTLSDPKVGITGSIQFALSALDYPVPEQDDLLWCIGPPLHHSFAQLLQTTDSALVDRAIGLYRDRFSTVGLFENTLYPEIPRVLQALRGLGHRCFVATSKPQVFARRIIEHFELTQLLDGIYGSELDGTRSDKGELIQYVLEQEKLASQACVMVGDRSHDAIGAKRNGLTSIGVTYGYGTTAELIANGVDYIAHTPEELISLFETIPLL